MDEKESRNARNRFTILAVLRRIDNDSGTKCGLATNTTFNQIETGIFGAEYGWRSEQ